MFSAVEIALSTWVFPHIYVVYVVVVSKFLFAIL